MMERMRNIDVGLVYELWNEYAAAANDGDMARWLSFWSEDGIQMPPGAPGWVGKEQIRQDGTRVLELCVLLLAACAQAEPPATTAPTLAPTPGPSTPMVTIELPDSTILSQLDIPYGPGEHKKTAHYQTWRDTVADMMVEPRSSIKYDNVFPDDEGWG
jgi:hypothetical protein